MGARPAHQASFTRPPTPFPGTHHLLMRDLPLSSHSNSAHRSIYTDCVAALIVSPEHTHGAARPAHTARRERATATRRGPAADLTNSNISLHAPPLSIDAIVSADMPRRRARRDLSTSRCRRPSRCAPLPSLDRHSPAAAAAAVRAAMQQLWRQARTHSLAHPLLLAAASARGSIRRRTSPHPTAHRARSRERAAERGHLLGERHRGG